MFGATAIGIGIGVIFLNNQRISGSVPAANNLILEDSSDYLQEDGMSVFLLE